MSAELEGQKGYEVAHEVEKLLAGGDLADIRRFKSTIEDLADVARNFLHATEKRDMPDDESSLLADITFEFEKETSKTVRYKEEEQPGVPARIGYLYVQKWLVGKDYPKRISALFWQEN